MTNFRSGAFFWIYGTRGPVPGVTTALPPSAARLAGVGLGARTKMAPPVIKRGALKSYTASRSGVMMDLVKRDRHEINVDARLGGCGANNVHRKPGWLAVLDLDKRRKVLLERHSHWFGSLRQSRPDGQGRDCQH